MPARAFRPVPEASSALLESRGSIVGEPDIDEEVEFGAVLLRCKLSLTALNAQNDVRSDVDFGKADAKQICRYCEIEVAARDVAFFVGHRHHREAERERDADQPDS